MLDGCHLQDVQKTQHMSLACVARQDNIILRVLDRQQGLQQGCTCVL